MPTSAKKCIRKCKQNRRKLKRTKVLKIFAAAMENVDSEGQVPSTSADPNVNVELTSDFFNTGRAGRRNALPDILSSHATISTADLPEQLGALTTTDSKPSSSSSTTVASSSNLTLDAQSTQSTTSQIATTSNS